MRLAEILFEESNKENNLHLHRLKQLLNCSEKGTWMLCLGAGISISAGLPNWHGLLAKIVAQLIVIDSTTECEGQVPYYRDIGKFYKNMQNKATFYERLQEALNGKYKKFFSGINVLEAAEYIRNFIDFSIQDTEKPQTDEEVRDWANWQINYFIQEACKSKMEISKDNEDIQKTTLGAVARLMKSEKDALIHNAITYNYDNLLETYLRNISGCPPEQVHSIIKKDEIRDLVTESDWNIYHVHGRVPSIEFPGEETSESVILTESDYYTEEQINYSWTNIVQSYAIARANLIFIGFSGADYNFRRIIKYVKQEKLREHQRYIFFSVDDIVYAVFEEEIQKRKSEEKEDWEILEECIAEMNKEDGEYLFETLFINYMIHFQTIYWEKHGLTVIWSSHGELPSVLNFLHSTTPPSEPSQIPI